MKKIFIIIWVLLFTSCSQFTDRRPSSETAENPTKYSNSEFLEFQYLVEESLVWRAKAVAYYNEHKVQYAKKNNLNHEDLVHLLESAKAYLDLRKRMMRYVDQNKDILEEIKNYRTDLDRDLVFQVKLGMASALVLYDNYMVGIYPYQNQKKTRKLLNHDMPGLEFELENISNSFFNNTNRVKLSRAISFYNTQLKYQEDMSYKPISNEVYLEELINQSPFYHFMLGRVNEGIKKPNQVKVIYNNIADYFNFMTDSFVFVASKTFGNSAGKVQSRNGKLFSMSEEEKNATKDTMKPLDILLEKTPFRLTDKFIPGYYGHVAIWIGNEEELKKLGIWDDPLIATYHEQIRSGHQIIEALRPGVEINKLEHFLDIDDLLVLRDQKLTDIQRREYILRAFEQVGKEYDFNFDVETDSKIVCSEIVYVVFHDIQWPTVKSMGRFTISPDNVASKAQGPDPFLVPVLMYKNGVKQEAPLLPKVVELLGK